MTTNLQIIGNAALLDLPDKVAFLSSRKISAADVLKCYEWAEEVRDTDQCVVSGFQSPLEKDVLKFLLRGKAPVILVLARKLWAKVPEELAGAVDAGRLLIVSPVKDARASAATAATRNRWILAHCSSLVLGSLDPDGNLAKLVATFPTRHVTCLRDDPKSVEIGIMDAWKAGTRREDWHDKRDWRDVREDDVRDDLDRGQFRFFSPSR